MGEKLKFIGMLALSFSVTCLAAAIVYFVYELSSWRKQLPEIFSLVADTSGQIAPALENVSEIEKLIPPIIEEVEAVRKTIDGVVAEVESTRKAIPGILADLEPIIRQLENTTAQFPEVIDPIVEEVGKTREMIPDILEEIKNTNATVRIAVTEIQQTREAIPGIMDRADQIVASAGEASMEAGKGAMTGMIGGIFGAPFSLLGAIGHGLTGSAGSETDQSVTEEDREIFMEKLLDLAESGKEGDVVTWRNRHTSNNGKITLLRRYLINEQECREVRIENNIKGQDPVTTTLSGCKQPDGSWVATQ